jgi:hypothetical protein
VDAVTVVIPWADVGDPRRGRAREYVTGRWADLARRTGTGWRIIISDTTGATPWVKADAVTAAAAQVDGGVIVVADADVWTDGINEAIQAVADGTARWAVPHLLVHRLTEEATERALETGILSGETHRRPYGGVAGGGIVVLRAEDYRRIPLDPRFRGWGQEDQAWGTALAAILGPPWRGSAPLWHLWHEPQARMTPSRGSKDGWTLASRYWRAVRSRTAMESIISEIRSGECPDLPEGRTSVWEYQNIRTGQIVKSAVRRDRLERLPNWKTVSEPTPVTQPAPQPEAESPATITIVEDTTTSDAPLVSCEATGIVMPPPATAPEAQGTQETTIPKTYAPKSDWIEAATALGVPDPSLLTKAELVEEVRQRAGIPG